MTARALLLLPLLFLGLDLSPTHAADYDWLIKNARIADGTGAPIVEGSIGIKDGHIMAIGDVSGSADRIVDAKGLVAAPGFIDVHTHSESITSNPLCENYVRMGVTTIVTGNCGASKTKVADFFQQAEEAGLGLNIATLIGHGSVRRAAMGGNFMRPPTDEELTEMKRIVGQAMRDGAVGMATGLIYVPGTYAETDEIVTLAKIVHAYDGIYSSHMRDEGPQIIDAINELIGIARESGCRAEISHLKLRSPAAWGQAKEILALIEKARKEGLSITHDQYAYTASSTGLRQLLPQSAFEGTHADFMTRLADPTQKAEIVKATLEKNRAEKRDDFSFAVIASCPSNPSLNGKTVAEAAKILHNDDSLDTQMETMLEILAENSQGRVSAIFHDMTEDDLETFLRHPQTMIASDGGPRLPDATVPHPRSYGNNARILGRYVRERNILSLEEAIRRMTSLPAITFHLDDRGQIAPGYAADIALFDPDIVTDLATFTQPHQYAVGFPHIFVNGQPIILNGNITDDRPGKALRKGTGERQ